MKNPNCGPCLSSPCPSEEIIMRTQNPPFGSRLSTIYHTSLKESLDGCGVSRLVGTREKGHQLLDCMRWLSAPQVINPVCMRVTVHILFVCRVLKKTSSDFVGGDDGSE